MTAFNVVRLKVKAGDEQKFVELHRSIKHNFKGFLGGALIKTGDQTYCLVGEWRNFKSIVAARPEMIGILDSMRDMLEDQGGGLGVTDPVSGETVVKMKGAAKPKPKAKKKTKARATARPKAKTGKSKARSKAKKPAKRPAKKR